MTLPARPVTDGLSVPRRPERPETPLFTAPTQYVTARRLALAAALPAPFSFHPRPLRPRGGRVAKAQALAENVEISFDAEADPHRGMPSG